MEECFLYHIIDPDCENYTCQSIITTRPIPKEIIEELRGIVVHENEKRFAEIMNELVANYGLRFLHYTDDIITDRHKVSPDNGWGGYIQDYVSYNPKIEVKFYFEEIGN